jgi:hypothetical protein
VKKTLIAGLVLAYLLSFLPLGMAGAGQEKVPLIVGFKGKPDEATIKGVGGEGVV